MFCAFELLTNTMYLLYNLHVIQLQEPFIQRIGINILQCFMLHLLSLYVSETSKSVKSVILITIDNEDSSYINITC